MIPVSRRALSSLLASWLLIAPSAAWAQGSSERQVVLEEVDVAVATVEVDGVALYDLRGISAFPAPLRARRVAERIIEAARNPEVDPKTHAAIVLADLEALRASAAP